MDTSGMSLLELAVAKTGRPIGDADVRITDKEHFRRLVDMKMGQSVKALAKNMDPAEAAGNDEWLVQEDGSLVLISTDEGGLSQQLTFPKGCWAYVSKAEAEAAETAFRSGDTESLSERLASSMRESADRTKAVMDKIDPTKIAAVIIVIDRSPDGLRPVAGMTGDRKEVSNLVSQWLETSSPFAAVLAGPSWQSVVGLKAFGAHQCDAVVELLKQRVLARGADPSNTLLSPSMADRSLGRAMISAWRAAGGGMLRADP